MKQDIIKLRELLEKASEICSNNLEAENIDIILKYSFRIVLHSMMETLDEYADELNEIENFEVSGE